MLSQIEASAIIDQIFAKVRGQENAKLKLKRKLLGALVDGFVKSTLIVGAPGFGKSRIIKAFNEACRAVLGRRAINIQNGAECGTKVSFVEMLLVPEFSGKSRNLVIDEIHEAKVPVVGILRGMLQPDAERSSVTINPHADYEVTFNPREQSIIIATNKIDKLDAAFASRFDRIDLVAYTDDELVLIFSDALEGAEINFHPSALKSFAECNRGSARDVLHWIDAIKEHCNISGQRNGRYSINREDVRAIIKLQSCFPLGVTVNELKTLLLLEEYGEMQLKELAAANIIDAKEQNSNEKYLLQRRLMAIEGKRRLTSQGVEYLAELRKDKYIAEKKDGSKVIG